MVPSQSGAAKAVTFNPKKSKRNLMDDSDSDFDSDEGGAQLDNSGLKVNEEYARRFEYNKKREERQKCMYTELGTPHVFDRTFNLLPPWNLTRHLVEEKYNANGKGQSARGRRYDDDEDEDEDDDKDSSSSNETEDEDGFLATEDLDAQISATLQAIRNKDPRVYDKDYKFIQLPDENETEKVKKEKQKPVFLRDYQREKLLRGDIGGSDTEDESAPQSYNQAQDALKRSIVSEIKAAKGEHDSDDSDSDSDDGGFMKKKTNSAESATATATATKIDSGAVHPSRAATIKVSELDVENADKDPETYLSNFLAARAWIPEEGGRWKAFESDDGEDNNMADEFEQAYNLRFEDPEKSNEVLKSYARDFAAARSVRREERSGRQRQRDLERERKEEEKRQRREEKARLRKLKLEETEEKLRKVKQAAGAVGKELTEAEWMAFLDDAWENDKWEEEMRKRFGDEYYAAEDDGAAGADSDDQDEEDEGNTEKKKKKRKHPKKPKWDDDIDIKDLVPDFEDDVKNIVPGISLAEDVDDAPEADDDDGEEQDEEEESRPSKKRKSSDHKRERLESQKQARLQRAKLEALVDAKLELTNHELLNNNNNNSSSSSSKNPPMAFRYREASPQSFGMTARDILLAPSDKNLNDFAGLKKLASFRDPEKKRRDKKRLGKKARLREWRRGTFGREFEKDGPTYGFEKLMEEGEDALMEDAPEVNAAERGEGKKKKRKRSKGKSKSA
ncbi:hypothetical protein E4U43_008223 [Claviceps pusilla]|uniref:Kri1-like C-terminal domain-containing protein n=1 Tax=Claviceps pusilla TaxID=123648 RepID=A0A9P7ND48_9HYPO|nr:hypothetical protein E4U43_008223 [Claviceps pusilla]